MTPEAFANRAVGIPWVRGRADWRACDCWGLLVLYYRHVIGAELAAVAQDIRDRLDIAAGFSAATGWHECEPEPGATCWMVWDHDAPTHCGVMLTAADLLHTDGRPDRPGKVRVIGLKAARRIYGDIRFYRYEAAAAC